MADERVYTIPLKEAYEKPRTKRAPRAIKIIKSFAARHMKGKVENVRISNYLNGIIWTRGIQKPPRRVKVKIKKDGDMIYVYALDEKPKAEPKREKKAEKKTEKKEEKKETKDKKEEKKAEKASDEKKEK